jgi:hypothetical protein
MNEPTFDSLYDTRSRSDLRVIGDDLEQTADPETLRSYARRLWVDVWLLAMTVDILRSRYGRLVLAARHTVATAGSELGDLCLELECAIDDPDLPVNYELTKEALAFLGSAAGRRS